MHWRRHTCGCRLLQHIPTTQPALHQADYFCIGLTNNLGFWTEKLTATVKCMSTCIVLYACCHSHQKTFLMILKAKCATLPPIPTTESLVAVVSCLLWDWVAPSGSFAVGFASLPAYRRQMCPASTTPGSLKVSLKPQNAPATLVVSIQPGVGVGEGKAAGSRWSQPAISRGSRSRNGFRDRIHHRCTAWLLTDTGFRRRILSCRLSRVWKVAQPLF